MKTLKTISLSLILAALATIATANSTVKTVISNADDLRKVLKEKVEFNLSETENILYKNGVDKMQENVEILFFITPEHRIRVISINSENEVASEFMKQLLNKEQLNVNDEMTNVMFKIDFKLNYRAG